MKPAAILATLLLTTPSTSAATLPAFRPRNGPPPHLALLHTLTPSIPSPARFSFSAQQAEAGAEAESTKGGAILTLPATDDNTTTTIKGTFVIPRAAPPSRGPTAGNPVGVYAASFWIGLVSAAPDCGGSGGGAGPTALRAGVDVFWDGSFGGEQTPFAWYQLPGQAAVRGVGNGSDFSVAPGDAVRVTLERGAGGRTARFVMEKLPPPPPSLPAGGADGAVGDDDGVVVAAEPLQRAEGTVELPGSVVGGGGECGGAGGRQAAAWMVEDFPLAGRPEFPVALVNFTSVTFEEAEVAYGAGVVRGVGEAELLDIRLDAQGGRLTRCESLGRARLGCRRVLGEEE